MSTKRLRHLALLFATICPFATAETIVCSYPDVYTKKSAVVELKIDGRVAHARWAEPKDFADDYRVLENTQYGLVLSRPYAGPFGDGATAPTIAVYTFLIERKSGAMRYLGFFVGDNDVNNSSGPT